jgi:hypothetical protein
VWCSFLLTLARHVIVDVLLTSDSVLLELQLIQYYAEKVIHLQAEKAANEVTKQINTALAK